jgi:hypothetical protein
MTTDPYALIDRRVNQVAGGDLGFTQLLPTAPRVISRSDRDIYESNYDAIMEFFRTTIDLFRASLRREADPWIADLLINEFPVQYGLEFHSSLPDAAFRPPAFFRTDQCSVNHLVEIQCPGSMWGDHQLLWDHFDGLNLLPSEPRFCPIVEGFSSQLADLLHEQPLVLHLSDNASSPQGVRYFIRRTRPAVKYFGYDDVKSLHCNFIRSHSVIGLLAENYATTRLRSLSETGTPRFDLPPYVIFDQKVQYALPFDNRTNQFYSDRVRDLFPHTAIIEPGGLQLPTGEKLPLEEYARRPQSQRAIYLKYAGNDVSRNWGSISVSRMTRNGSDAVLRTLTEKAADLAGQRPWIVQQEEHWKESASFYERGSIESIEETRRAKYSAFYGPGGLLGVMSMHGDKKKSKQHGQSDTIANVCVGE